MTTDYAYDGTMLVQEFQTNAQTGQLAATATYMPGPSGPICRINESNQTEGYYPAGVSSNAPLARGVTRWYVYDGLGSKIAELDDNNNNMTTSGQYDVYGAPRAGTQQGVAATSSQGYVGRLGHVTDASTGGLIYMQARYYDPGLGRFVSEDPKQSGENWYAYCSGDPVNNVDANGKSVASIMSMIIDLLIILSTVLCIIAIWEVAAVVFDFVMADVATGATADVLTAAIARGCLLAAANSWKYLVCGTILGNVANLMEHHEAEIDKALDSIDSPGPDSGPPSDTLGQEPATNV